MQKVWADMQKVWADSGYWGDPFEKGMKQRHGWKIESVSRNELVNRRRGTPAFVPLPRRWVVERTFVWPGNWRRLSCDYEHNQDPARHGFIAP